MKRLIHIFVLLAPLISFGQMNDSVAIKSVEKIEFAIEDTFDYFTLIDTNFSRYTLPTDFEKPENWKKAEKSREDFERYGNSYSDTFNLDDALSIIDSAKDFGTIMSAKSWCIDNYEKAFPYLVTRLSMKKKIGMENSADLIIWDRIRTGDLKFYGHGGGMNEDIFTIAGRASWILNELTGEDFASVQIDLTEEQVIKFKNMWLNYIGSLYKN
jgi:hypothetical protein